MGIRIIDANALTEDLTYDFTGHPMNGHRKTTFADIRAMILCQPTIDPETLPIVQELRKKLEQVTAERDAAVNDVQCLVIGKLKACDYCKHNNPYNFDCPMTKQFGYCGYWEWRGAVAENATAGNGGQNDD